MYRIGFLLISIFLLVSQSVAIESEHLDFSGVIKSRKVIGVIYFKNNSVKLSNTQQAEIDRISSLVVSQCSSDKVVRVEGFATKSDRRAGLLNASLLRAKSVWYYLRKMDPLNSSNLYLTGFSARQSISNLQGERVE